MEYFSLLDLFLLTTLGFLGSFGHCASMCGPITAAFSLSQQQQFGQNSRSDSALDFLPDSPRHHPPPSSHLWQSLRFHGLLNLGRILSYALVGAGMGALGSVLVAGGQMAGLGSVLRRVMSILTGGLLIWFGLSQIQPSGLPRIPLLHPLTQGKLHDRLRQGMVSLSFKTHWWTPFGLGMVWGLIPCGFLYTAQLKAAETSHLWLGCLTMLAFGLGTVPMMMGVGVSAGFMSRDRRSQLFRMGGWITLAIGVLTLLRTGDTMSDYTGHGSLICLGLALIARPISQVWDTLLRYRRALGVGAFILAIAHTTHMLAHVWQWNFAAFAFMLPQHQLAIVLGAIALVLMTPLAATSFDWAQKTMGRAWRSLHLLSVPAIVVAIIHSVLIGSSYLGGLQVTGMNRWMTGGLLGIGLITLLIRCRFAWSFLALEKFYAAPQRSLRE